MSLSGGGVRVSSIKSDSHIFSSELFVPAYIFSTMWLSDTVWLRNFRRSSLRGKIRRSSSTALPRTKTDA
jgi:hypothetical protein